MNKTQESLISTLYTNSVSKSDKTFVNLLLLGIMGGASVSLGALGHLNLVSSFIHSNIHLGKLLGASIFPVGLMLILFIGFELFTSNCLLFTGYLGGKITFKKVVYNLLTVYLGNILGVFFITFVNLLIGGINVDSGNVLSTIITTKSNILWYSVLLRGVLCNLLVCCAICIAYVSRDSIGKIIGIWFPICLFVLLGYEHCVANMFYFFMGWLELNNITIGMVSNLVFSTLGNLAGGMMLSCVLYITKN